jgi:hypothetical protein
MRRDQPGRPSGWLPRRSYRQAYWPDGSSQKTLLDLDRALPCRTVTGSVQRDCRPRGDVGVTTNIGDDVIKAYESILRNLYQLDIAASRYSASPLRMSSQCYGPLRGRAALNCDPPGPHLLDRSAQCPHGRRPMQRHRPVRVYLPQAVTGPIEIFG